MLARNVAPSLLALALLAPATAAAQDAPSDPVATPTSARNAVYVELFGNGIGEEDGTELEAGAYGTGTLGISIGYAF